MHMLDTVFPKIGKQSGLKGKSLTVIGQSNIVGRPLSIMLQNEGATVRMCDKFTRNLKSEVTDADVIISGTGVHGLVNAELVEATGRSDLTVIDAGITKVGKKVVGDADPEIYDKVAAYTPVPGGVGPVTVAFLMRNVLKAYSIQHELPVPALPWKKH
jgi:methylenetetrahydrofolate dehydrogenase (NADP+)/methenyltetrahydrofolate cyclohydrolase